MEWDKKTIDRLLKLNDEQLLAVLRQVAGEAGVDVSSLRADSAGLAALRAALSFSTDEQIAAVLQQWKKP